VVDPQRMSHKNKAYPGFFTDSQGIHQANNSVVGFVKTFINSTSNQPRNLSPRTFPNLEASCKRVLRSRPEENLFQVRSL
jgi:hypothetical protein